MDNQQETPSPEELAWFAGFFEGEGSLTLYARKQKWNGWEGLSVDLNMTLVNTDGCLIEKSMGIIRKLGVEPKIFERAARPPVEGYDGVMRHQRKSQLVINISKMTTIKRVLEAVLPYFAGDKRARSRLILQFIDRRLTRRAAVKQKRVGYEPEDWQIIQNFYDISGAKIRPEVREALEAAVHSG